MTDALATTSTAANNPTPPGQVTQRQAEPTRHDGAARPGVIARNEYDRLPPDKQAAYAHVPREGGGQDIVPRNSLPSEQPTATAASDTTTTAAPQKAVVTDDGKLRVGSMELSEADIQQIMTESAAREARKATMPATAADYRLDLPADFVMPEGQSFQFTPDHPVLGPIIGQAKELALSLGMDQAGFSKMMGLYAASQVHEAQLISKAAAAEVAKLGANVTARVTAVTQFIRGAVGDDKIAGAITRQLLTADQIVGWERIISKAATQGHASFTQHGRVPENPNRGPLSSMSDEQYNSMSASERFRLSRLG
jgi:hypothetical protein